MISYLLYLIAKHMTNSIIFTIIVLLPGVILDTLIFDKVVEKSEKW